MKKEIELYTAQLKESFAGDPWFGRHMQALLQEVEAKLAAQKPGGNQHSMLELLYHIINWRQFTISRLQSNATNDLHYFEQNDWQQLDHADTNLWQKGLDNLQETQKTLLQLLGNMTDEDLDAPVKERNYSNRNLVAGIIQHDIYHLGQIAYIKKLLTEQS